MEIKTGKKRKSAKKWLFIIGALLLVLGSGAFVFLKTTTASAASSSTSYTTQAVKVADLTSTVSATGNIYTKQSVSMNWKTSGTVSKVYVTKGEQVTAGTLLAELDQSTLTQDVIDAATTLATAKQDLDDLLNSDSTRAKAELAMVEAEQTYVSEQDTVDSELYNQSTEQNIEIYYADVINAKDTLTRAEDAFNKVSGYATDDVQYVNALSSLATAQQDYVTAQTNYDDLFSLTSSDDIELANATLAVDKAAYLDAKRAWEKVKDGPSATDIATAEAKVSAAQAILDEAYIYAPIDGTVTVINSQVGDLVSTSTAAFQIDDMSQMYVDISVSELDISKVSVGQTASISLDAISDKTYEGKVTDISTTGTNSSNSVNFTVTVELTNADSEIKSGMTATADITVSTISNAVLVPSSAIRTVNSQKKVYILQNNTVQTVTITTGEVGDTLTQVTSGNLKAGELVILNPTSTTTTTTSSTSLLSSLFGGLLGGSTSGGASSGGSAPSGSFSGGSGGPSDTGGSAPSGSSSSGGGSAPSGSGN